MIELKPCPFCGGKAYTQRMHIAYIWMIKCGKCGAIVSFEGKEKFDKCVDAWNTRKEVEE